MATRNIKRVCLSCKNYRPLDESQGKCRLNKGTIDPAAYPIMNHQDVCESWQDVGQQYHIRRGWVKGQRNKKEGEIGPQKEDS